MQLAHSRFLDSESKAQNDCCPRRSCSCCGRSIFSGVSYGGRSYRQARQVRREGRSLRSCAPQPWDAERPELGLPASDASLRLPGQSDPAGRPFCAALSRRPGLRWPCASAARVPTRSLEENIAFRGPVAQVAATGHMWL